MPILQDEIWRKTQKLLAAGRMRSTLFGYSESSCVMIVRNVKVRGKYVFIRAGFFEILGKHQD